uniref:Uncharacterized protein n=1 Tax=Castor canadensis TaxID=51338 RepID=A0A8C0WA18_CASCN
MIPSGYLCLNRATTSGSSKWIPSNWFPRLKGLRLLKIYFLLKLFNIAILALSVMIQMRKTWDHNTLDINHNNENV